MDIKDSTTEEKKMVTVYVEKDLARDFKVRVEAVNLDMSKVVRQMMADYLMKDMAEVEMSAAEIKRAELHKYILDELRAFAASKRHDRDFLDWIGKGVGIKRPGTLYALLEE